MKFSILFFFLFICSVSLAQTDKADENKSDFLIPKNKTALNDLIEETKAKITDADKKIKSLNSYAQSLSNYKTKVSSLVPNDVESILGEIEKNINSKNSSSIYTQEEALINYFNKFGFGYSYVLSASEDLPDNSTFSNFRTKIQEFTKNFTTSDLLRQVSNHHDNEDEIATLIDGDKLNRVREVINSNSIKDFQTKILPVIDGEISNNQKNIEAAKVDLQKLKTYKNDLINKLDEEETNINSLAIKLGLPFFCLTILLLFLLPGFIKRPTTSTTDQSQNVLLEISTVLLLTMSILILGLSGKIQSDVLGTLIGGISGYVLNRIRTRNDALPPAPLAPAAPQQIAPTPASPPQVAPALAA